MSKRSRKRVRGNTPRKQILAKDAGIINFIRAPAYQQQDVVRMRVKASPYVLSTTVTTGVISSAFALEPTSKIGDFGARFQSTFDEYMVTKVRLRIRPLTTATGVSSFFFDEKSSTAPTLAMANERQSTILSHAQANSSSFKVMNFITRDLLDLQFTDITTGKILGYFKVYTDTANFGAPIAVTALWIIEPEFTILFKGLKSA
jgi:hypothetical protein